MEKVRIQDDLYQFVNGEELAKAIIPEDRPTTGGFTLLEEGVEKLLIDDLQDMLATKKQTPAIESFNDALIFFKQVLDIKRRNKEGFKPLAKFLKRIEYIKTLDDFNNNLKDLLLEGFSLPINVGIDPDMKDALHHCFALQGPSIILPDTTYYSDDNKEGTKLISIYREMISKLLSYTSLSKETQERYISDTLSFDRTVAKYVKSQVEWADYVNSYNPFSLEEVCDYLKPLAFKELLISLYGDKIPKQIIVNDPRAIKEFCKYFNEETFSQFIHWSYVKTLVANTSYLSEELVSLGHMYSHALVGIAKEPNLEKQAYRATSSLFAEPIGIYYGRTYFGEEAKKDIIALVKKIIATYKLRIEKNTFFTPETKIKAIQKLETMTIKMGYPDKVREVYKGMKVKADDSYFDSVHKLSTYLYKNEFDKLYKDVNHQEWAMPAHMVNACYNPTCNDITFPAAILQKPFYSLSQNLATNLGGIGAVIGHEISHAFDNNGARFDENGNLNNWWTDKDFAEFGKLTKDMISQFEGLDYHGGKVNGELVVSENIADNGGMAVTLQIMKQENNANYHDYFINWARVWCMKAKEEFILFLLSCDVHSPGELRANMQPRNFSEWYATFDVKEKDGMYLKPNKRVIIW